MKKIPTLFVRDMSKQPALIIDQVTPGCEWVLAGEGVPTRKWDGTCCLLRDGKFYGRREVKQGQPTPADFELTESDPNTGKSFGWVPIDDSPEWKWHNKAFDNSSDQKLADGTYEAIGPHFQKNPEGVAMDRLVPHGQMRADVALTLSFDGLRSALQILEWEGLVWWHPDGRRAKLKLKDYGLRRS